MKLVHLWFPLAFSIAAGVICMMTVGLQDLPRGVIALALVTASTGAMAWCLQLAALMYARLHTQKKLNLPTAWFSTRDHPLPFTRNPRYQAAFRASYPFMRLQDPPQVPEDLTWPLEPDNDHGLTRLMASLYRAHRQDRHGMHLSVHREVMRLDAAARKIGRSHADVSALAQKLGYKQALSVLEQDIPTELALALV